MKILNWVFTLLFWMLVATFFHYTLPQKDIVRVTDTENRRIDFGENSIFWAGADAGNAETTANRDVFFIQTVQANGRPMVYRNEDTGWRWPPYFKFDTQNLQTEAADLKSTADAPRWALITHYGWRINYFSIFPNAISIQPHPGPDAPKPWPWVNILILTSVAAVWYGLWVRWRRFRQKRIDPTLEQIQDNLEEAGDRMAARRGRARKWLDSWRS